MGDKAPESHGRARRMLERVFARDVTANVITFLIIAGLTATAAAIGAWAPWSDSEDLPAATVQRTFAPVDGDYPPTARSVEGQCTPSGVIARVDAHRCYSKPWIFDPCFGSLALGRAEVMCPRWPEEADIDVTIVHVDLSGDPPNVDPALPYTEAELQAASEAQGAWALELLDEVRCFKTLDGTRKRPDINLVPTGATQLYACWKGGRTGLVLGELDDSQPLWRARLLWSDESATSMVPVVTAWH